MIPKTRQELHDRIKIDLGEPVIKVNLAPEQIENAIDDALEYWQQWHHEAQEHSIIKILLTKEMLDNNQIPVPASVFSVKSIVAGTSSPALTDFMNYEFEMTRDMIYDAAKGAGSSGFNSYVMNRERFATISHLMAAPNVFDFRLHKGYITLMENAKSRYEPGDYIALEVYGFLSRNSFNVWGDEALRKLATAHAKKRWGQNLSKFQGVALPGGITMNGSELYQQGQDDIEKYEQYILDLTEPYSIIIG